TIKYTSPGLTQKVFANMRRVGKGFSGVETPLFEGMVVAQEVGEGVADEVHDEGVLVAGVATEGDVSAANDEAPTANEEPSIPSPTPPTPPPQSSQDIPSTSQFWTTFAVKKVNDVTRLQALVDKKKVVVTEAMIRDTLRLNDAKGVECQPNEEIFAELARMGYEKPSTKLTFYKTFFSSQWKFLIHIILQCMSAKRTSWNESSSSIASAVICLSSGRKFNFLKHIFDNLVRNVDSPTKFYMYHRFLQLIIRKQVGDLSTHTIKYTSPGLTQKVFANMRRVGKGFSGVETPLFEGMVVAQEVGEGVADEVHDEGVLVAGVATEGDVSAANDEAPTANEEPSIPSPTPPTPPPQSSQDIPSTSQVQPTPPQVQPQSPQG
nr:hypothetical protein [Tanacetum cinerariifolium]